MEFSLPTFTWVLRRPVLLCHGTQYLHADPQDHVNHLCHMAALGKDQQGPEVHCHPQLVALVQGQPRLYKTLSQK